MKFNSLEDVIKLLNLHIQEKQQYIDDFNKQIADPNRQWDDRDNLIMITKNGMKQLVFDLLMEQSVLKQAIERIKNETN